MTQKEDRHLAARLFGTVCGKIKATGGHSPEPSDLHAELEWEDGFMACFCTGCGSVFEVDRQGAQQLALMAEIGVPDKPADLYFEVDGCEVCDAQMRVVRLRRIVNRIASLGKGNGFEQ
jgi:hypothetical protein